MFINGKEMDYKEGIVVSKILKDLNICKDRVVVEVNFEIISKGEYETFILNKGDKVEIVSFVGGG